MHAAGFASATFDRSLRILVASAEFARLLGARGALRGKTLAACAPHAAPILEHVLALAFAKPRLRSLAVAVTLAVGSETVLLHFTRGATGDSLTVGLEMLTPDVQGSLAGEEWAARTPLAWTRFSPSFRIEAWSDTAAELFGWSFADVVGRTPFELGLIHPDDIAHVNRKAADLYASPSRSNTSVHRNITRDGRTLNIAWYNSVATRPDGDACVALALDVTDSFDARAAAAASERRLRSLFERNHDAVLAIDAARTIVDANPAALAAFSTEIEPLVGKSVFDIAAPEERGALVRALDAVASGLSVAQTFRFRRNNGSFSESEVGGSTVDDTGSIYLVIRDVSLERSAERKLAAQAERIRELYTVAASTGASNERQITATLETGCRLLDMSFATVFDATNEEQALWVRERVPAVLMRLPLGTDGPLAIDDLDGLSELLEGAATTPIRSYIATSIDIEGARFGSLAFASPSPRQEPFSETDCDLVQLMSALVASALERRSARTRLNALAYTDALTDLPNRAHLIERLQQAIVFASHRDAAFGVLFCDLDRFKDVNDTLGHPAGDRLLQIVGMRLRACLGSTATVARMGGDEFAILVPELESADELDRLAERILAAIDEPFAFDGYEQFVSTSIGIATYPADGRDADTLLKHADIAMYTAKARGRNTYQRFTLDLDSAIRGRIAQELRLRSALSNNEFVVHYMPQIELATNQLVGVEALVRWQHPQLGLVPPDQFIPSAEMSGLIVPLGDWVIENACAQVAAWQRNFATPFRLAVNLSGRQFHRAELGSRIAEVQRDSGLAPRTLEVEITESVAMSDAEYSAGVMLDLRSAGISISVDDFGTGYSSLGYLRRFAIDSIKIDKSFVKDVVTVADDAVIVRTIVAMAHALNLEIIAEGVETAEQRDFLRAVGCERAQGYLFSPALSADAMSAYMGRRVPSR